MTVLRGPRSRPQQVGKAHKSLQAGDCCYAMPPVALLMAGVLGNRGSLLIGGLLGSRRLPVSLLWSRRCRRFVALVDLATVTDCSLTRSRLGLWKRDGLNIFGISIQHALDCEFKDASVGSHFAN